MKWLLCLLFRMIFLIISANGILIEKSIARRCVSSFQLVCLFFLQKRKCIRYIVKHLIFKHTYIFRQIKRNLEKSMTFLKISQIVGKSTIDYSCKNDALIRLKLIKSHLKLPFSSFHLDVSFDLIWIFKTNRICISEKDSLKFMCLI